MGRSDDKHQDILCAAIREFGEKGMMATTMESIANQAGVSKRTLYKLVMITAIPARRRAKN